MVINIEKAKFEKHHLQNKNLKAEKDSRKHPRRPCNKPIFFTSKNQHAAGLATNISRGGAFHASKNHKGLRLRGWIVRLGPEGVGVSFDRRSGRERRYDLDRRTGLNRRKADKRHSVRITL